jgi:glutamine phosphoribosylpyrophosphate amidotransferase
MCGIVGYLGIDDYKKYILSGLKLLQNRGYDSVGVSSIINNEKLDTIKFASTDTNDALKILEAEVEKHSYEKSINVAIGHTRWATHGGKTDINAHPHHDNKDRISLVHNGIIENYSELKQSLLKEGFFFRSQTDTEVIAVLIGKYLDNGETMENSIKKTIVVDSSTNPLNSIYINSEKKAVQIDPVEKMKKKEKKVEKKPEFQLARDKLFNSLGLKKGLHFYIKDHRTTEPVS